MAATLSMRNEIPQDVIDLIQILQTAGYSTYIVGGSIRNLLLQIPVKDWDIATEARPEEIQELFPRHLYENNFGTVTVKWAGEQYEITTFRSDGDYTDNRRPDDVQFTRDILTDLARRDFTMNAIAYDPIENELIDPHGGQFAIANKLIGTVGTPFDRFNEDALRMLRAVRFVSQLGFTMDRGTKIAINHSRNLITTVSGERVVDEFRKLFRGKKVELGLWAAWDTGLLSSTFRELHLDNWTDFEPSVKAICLADKDVVRFAALFHFASEKDLPGILNRLHFSGDESARINRVLTRAGALDLTSGTDEELRRAIKYIGKYYLDDVIAYREVYPDIRLDPDLLARIAKQRMMPLTRDGLAINGTELMEELHTGPGKKLGQLLEDLLDAVIVNPNLNNYNTLVRKAKNIWEQMNAES